MAYKYVNRTFSVPSTSWVIPTLTSDIITNDLLDDLYIYFSCSAGQIATPYIQNLKKGIIQELPSSIQFIEDALMVLQAWYNGGFSFAGPFSYGSQYSTSLYWATSNTDNTETQPLVLKVAHGSNINDFITNLTLALPQGYEVTILNSVGIYIQTVNAQHQYLYAISYNNSSIQAAAWFTIDFWSCMSYATVQNLIQNLLKVAGCVNCGNTSLIESDNVYTSRPLLPPSLVAIIPTSYKNPIY